MVCQIPTKEQSTRRNKTLFPVAIDVLIPFLSFNLTNTGATNRIGMAIFAHVKRSTASNGTRAEPAP